MLKGKDKEKLFVNIGSMISAFAAVFSANKILTDGSLRLSDSVMSVILFAAFFAVIKYAIEKCQEISWAFAVVSGILFAVLWVLGDNLTSSDYTMIASWRTWAKIVLIIPLFISVFHILEKMIFLAAEKYRNRTENSLLKNDKAGFIITFVLILISWIPVFLAAFPGIYAYDAVTQTAEFYADAGLSGHHPIAHTALLWGLISLGRTLFGSYGAGMALYSIVQMLIMASIFAYVIHMLKKWNCPKIIRVCCLLFYMFVPVHSVLAISATKDVLFSGFFTLVVLFLVDFSMDADSFMRSPFKWIRFILAVFAMAAFRNNGIYAFVVCIPFIIWTGRKYWKKAVALCLCCILIYGVYSGPVNTMLGVEPGNFREALSVPIQQLSRAMLYNSDELTAEEKKKITELIPDYMNYTPRISDSTKGTFQTEKMKEDVIGFIKLWISVGIKAPITYIDAFMSNSIGFWYPDMQYPDSGAFHAYIEYENTPYDFHTGGEYAMDDSFLLIERDSKLPALDRALHNWVYDVSHQRIPVISMLFSVGMYAWILLITVILCVCRKQWKMLPACMFLVGLWLTLLLSPVVVYRYGYALGICIPIMLALCLKFCCGTVKSAGLAK